MIHVKQNLTAVNDLKLSKLIEQYNVLHKQQLFMSRGPLTTHIPHFGNTVRMSFFTSLLLRIKIFFFILIPAQNLTSSFHPKH